MKVAVSGPDTTLARALLAALGDARWDIIRVGQSMGNGADRAHVQAASAPDTALAQADVLYILDMLAAGADAKRLDHITSLITTAAAGSIRRIVLLTPSGPADAGRTAETVLQQTRGCDWVVIRAPDLYDPQDPELRATLKRIMIDGVSAADQTPFRRLHPLDLCAALVVAARSEAAAGQVLEVADQVTLSPDILAAELQRLGRLFSDAQATEDRVRPDYPTEMVASDVAPAHQALGIMPARRGWTGLAECSQAIVKDLRREGRVADNTPKLPPLLQALESGSKPLTGKVCLVTGATAGIGRALSVILSRCGAHVIATGRNEAAGTDLLEELSSRPSCTPGRFIAADLSSRAQIADLLEVVTQAHPKVDVLVNNAGAVFTDRKMTPDGIEASFAVNHLAPFLITRGLLEHMTTDGHVINLFCDIAETSGLDFGDLFCAQDYAPLDAYARAKFASMMFTASLMRRADATGPRICAVNPGDVRTGLLEDRVLAKRPEVAALLRFRNQMASPDQAAGFVASILIDPAFAGQASIYARQGAIGQVLPAADDPAAGARLWEISDAMSGPGWQPAA